MPRRYIDRRAEAEIEAMLARGDLAQAKKDEQPAGEPSTAKAHSGRRAPGDWQGLVEQRIQDGMERGLFDNLRGMGQPLNLDEDQFVPDEMKMAFRLLRSNGLAPLWVELNKEIRDDIARLERFRVYAQSRLASNVIELEHLRREYVKRVTEINDKIVNYNIIAPSSHVHLALLIIEEELAKFDQQQS
jgi:DnaJ family protein C protein 28